MNIMYNAGFEEKASGKALFYKLIDAGIITMEEATKLNLIEDETVTEIDELLVFNQFSITILFNEDIKTIDDIKIYQANNENRELAFGIEEMKEDYVILKTEKQTPGMEYTVEIHNVADINGNIQEELYTAFIGYVQETVESGFFRIQKIEPMNEKTVKLYFTHPVNLNSENPLFYNISHESYTFASGEKRSASGTYRNC